MQNPGPKPLSVVPYRNPFASRQTLLFVLIALFLISFCIGCGGSMNAPAPASTPSSAPAASPSPAPSPTPLTVAPANTTIQAGQTINLSVSGETANTSCSWTTSNPSILAIVGDEQFEGQQAGNATVSVACGSQSAQAIVTVVPQAASGPITITAGGTYSGTWTSNDPSTAAVTITTDDPVTLENSTITSRGTLIRLSGVSTGANVTIENVSGTALDPGVSGMQRGSFIVASKINSLIVRNCTMTGVSFGVNAVSSTVSTLQIDNNLAVNLEDRASDGQGGLLPKEPYYGHFVILSAISAPSGAEIAWNQVMQTMGQSSTTDVINIYRSQGAPGLPIWVHDNYIQGSSSPDFPNNFSGVGIIADGGKAAPVTAYALFQNNQIVHTAGSGVSIDNGHDVTATGNRVVSCGQDASGNWYAAPFANAVSIWDSYGSGPSLFYNNTVTDSAGGLVRPNSSGNPMAADFWGSSLSMTYPGNSTSGNDFTNSCLANGAVNGQLNLAAEAAELSYWTAKVTAANQQIGSRQPSAQ
jgi:hypothetical protein